MRPIAPGAARAHLAQVVTREHVKSRVLCGVSDLRGSTASAKKPIVPTEILFSFSTITVTGSDIDAIPRCVARRLA